MTALSNQFQMLRARIENSVSTPFSLVVSSAQLDDGKSVCAVGLAESMASAGYRTLLIDLDHEVPTLDALPGPTSLVGNGEADHLDRSLVFDEESRLTLLSLANEKMCESASKDDVAATLAHFREQFDVVVVDAARLTESSIGVLFARMCDAVILTARKGRSVRKNDRATAETVEREGAKLLGIVTVAPEAIRSAKRRPLGSKQNIGSVVYRTTPTMESVVASRIG